MKLYALKKNKIGVLIGEKILIVEKAREHIFDLKKCPDTILSLVEDNGSGIAVLENFLEKLKTDIVLQKNLENAEALLPIDQVKFEAPLTGPRALVAVGMNYVDHLEEMDTAPPEHPHVFIKSYSAIVGPGESIVLPKDHENMVDWEAELVVVIGKTCHEIKAENAKDYVFGYMAANDLSARDWVQQTFDSKTHMDAINNWCINLLGKQFPTFCPIGPCLVTKSEISDPTNLKIECRVNGQVMQSSHTSKMLFSVAQVVEYVSKFYILKPGDAILTGTMAGVGYGRNPKVFLKKGDVVEVEIEKIGILKNSVLI